MTTAYLTHPASQTHDTGSGHPERSARLPAIEEHLITDGILDFLTHIQAPKATREQLLRVHSKEHVERIFSQAPESGFVHLDPDTVMSPGSLEAALHSAGAAVHATELVFRDDIDDAFCCTRPPGHHATRDTAMGFCLFNNIAVAAAHALDALGLKRVAIIDFDVHHGNGTVDIFKDRPEVLVCSSFQHPYYPHRYADIVRDNIVNTPLTAGTGGVDFRRAVEADWTEAVERQRPQLILVSAGFDAHRQDPLAQLELSEDDFRWVTELICDFAERYAGGRIVSTLEGGYDLAALAASAHVHIETLHSA